MWYLLNVEKWLFIFLSTFHTDPESVSFFVTKWTFLSINILITFCWENVIYVPDCTRLSWWIVSNIKIPHFRSLSITAAWCLKWNQPAAKNDKRPTYLICYFLRTNSKLKIRFPIVTQVTWRKEPSLGKLRYFYLQKDIYFPDILCCISFWTKWENLFL